MEQQMNMPRQSEVIRNQVTNDTLTLMDIVNLFIPKWKWFIGCLIVSIIAVAFYLAKTPYVYTKAATVLIKDEGTASKAQAARSQFNIMDGMFIDANVENEIITISSPTIMAFVVEKLGLNEVYMTKKGLRPVELYKKSPILVSFKNPDQAFGVAFQVKIIDGENVVLSDFRYKRDEFKDVIEASLGQQVETPVGVVMISPTTFLDEECYGMKINYSRSTIMNTAIAYVKRLKADKTNKNATAIDLAFSDPNQQKIEDVLNGVIESYKEYWVMDRNKVSVQTSKFVSDRLMKLEEQLSNVDKDISSYKAQNLLPDIKTAASTYMEEDLRTKNDLMKLMNQKNIILTIENQLKNKTSQDRLLPANSGIENSSINSGIAQYNTIFMERQRLLSNSSEKNPLVQDLTVNLEALKVSIIESIESYIEVIDVQLESLNKLASTTQERLEASPSQARYLVSVERQQKVMEALYLYLLQKYEENEMSQTFVANNTHLLTPPVGSPNPTSPHKMKLLLAAFVIGLGLPAAVIYILETLNTTVRGKTDIQSLDLPFIGEVPLVGSDKTGAKKFFGKKEEKGREILVKERSRNIINEAMRVVRTNFEMRNRLDKNKVFMITSMNAGSGKTFVSANLAMSLAIKGSNVCLLDFDIRRAQTSVFVNNPKKGVVDYLVGDVADVDAITVKGFKNSHLDIIPVGTIPPNPTEILLDGKVNELFTALRAKYDYVLVDCPPVDIVADASIISEHVDSTIFVIRVGLLQRTLLPMIAEFKENNKYPNMCLILNGVKQYIGGKYGYHNYNYYSYGHYGKYHYHSKD